MPFSFQRIAEHLKAFDFIFIFKPGKPEFQEFAKS